MKPLLTRLLIAVAFAFILSLTSTWFSIPQTNVEAQEPCPPVSPLNMPEWKPGTTVTVVFDQNYEWSDATINAMKRAFENWNDANGPDGNNSGVTFVGYQRGAIPDRNSANNLFIITKDPDATQTSTGNVANVSSGAYAAYSKMIFPTTTNLEPPSYDSEGWSLTGLVAHEIGHAFNLGDCYTCTGTVMCVACGLYGPTPCDNADVKEYNNYTEDCQPTTNSPGPEYIWDYNSCDWLPAACDPSDWQIRVCNTVREPSTRILVIVTHLL